MKHLYSIITFVFISSIVSAQLKYDDGGISTGQDFVTVRPWNHANITYFFQNGTNDIAANDERNAIRTAFQIWADYVPLTFTEVTTANSADIIVLWGVNNHGDGFPFDGVNGTLAHGFFPPPNGNFAGDVHFDDAETWTLVERPIGAGQPIDLVTVAAHEIGHAIGLDHSNVACALMNPFYNGSHRYLSQDDIDGMRTLYGNRLAIIGTNVTCNGGTYSLRNVPTGGFINWQSSNTAIATVNNQGVVARVGSANGQIVLTAHLNLSCGTIVNEATNVFIGTPAKPGTITTVLADYHTGKIQVQIEPVLGATSYNWYKDGVLLNTQGQHGTFIQIPIPRNICDVGYGIEVEAINSCGTSAKTYKGVFIPCDDNFYAVSPNPATSNITVSVADSKTQSIDGKTFDGVKIYDMQGTIKKYQHYNSVKQASINISTLNNGTYFIEVTNGIYKEKHQLIIQK